MLYKILSYLNSDCDTTTQINNYYYENNSKYMQLYCSVLRSGHLCFTSLALLWTRGISLRGTTPRGVTFYGLSAQRAVTRFIFNREPCIASVPLEGWYG